MKTRTTLLALFVLALISTGAASAQTGQTCGGIGALRCPEGQGCLYPAGQCNQPDLAGTCVVVEETCPKQGPPICGCNGTTYANQCELVKAGVRPDRKGSCGNSKKSQASETGAQLFCPVTSPKSS